MKKENELAAEAEEEENYKLEDTIINE